VPAITNLFLVVEIPHFYYVNMNDREAVMQAILWEIQT
jgi:hypothetical protein